MKLFSWSAIRIALFLFLISSAFRVPAITITYVNTGTDDGRVAGGYDNDSSGNLTSDFVEDPFAISTAATLFGPLPPAGQLPSFDAQTDSRAEMGTNLLKPESTYRIEVLVSGKSIWEACFSLR